MMSTYVVSQYCRISGFQLFMLISTTLLFKISTESCFWCFEEEDQDTVAEFTSSCGIYNFTRIVNGGKRFVNRAEFWEFLRTYLHTKNKAIITWEPCDNKPQNVISGALSIKSDLVCRLEVCFSEKNVLVNGTVSVEYITVVIKHVHMKFHPYIFSSMHRNSLRQYKRGKCLAVSSKHYLSNKSVDQDVKDVNSRQSDAMNAERSTRRIRSVGHIHAEPVTTLHVNRSQDLVPTFRLPTIHTIPARAVLIGPSNLVPEQGQDRFYNEQSFWARKFHILQVACGVFQTLSGHDVGDNKHWTAVEQFTGDQVLRRQVRYLSTLMQPDDAAPFEDLIHLTCLGFSGVNNTRVRLLLPVIFTRIHLKLYTLKPFILDLMYPPSKSSSDSVSSLGRTRSIELSHLQVSVRPPERDQSIYFTILLVPKHGHLFLNDKFKSNNQSASQIREKPSVTEKTYLGVNSQFTQQHIRDGCLFYTFRRVLDDGLQFHTEDAVRDGFDFRVHVPGAQLKTVHHFQIAIRNSQEAEKMRTRIRGTIRIVYEPARIPEGGLFVFQPTNFYASQKGCTPPNFDMYFQVLALPNHGVLQFCRELDRSQKVLVRRFTFYPVNIIDKKLMEYRHDDSETNSDNFQYQFVCQTTRLSQNPTVQESHFVGEPMVGTFRIDIAPVNDNPPCLRTQPLSVDLNKTTPIVSRWISVTDQDSTENGTKDDPKQFPITWKAVSYLERSDFGPYPKLGQFQNLATNRRVDTFTMEDVIRGNLSFRHMGSPMGYIRLHVTDGKFHSSSDVFINMSTAAFLVMPPVRFFIGDSDVGTPLFFEVLTNIKLDPRNIFVTLTGSLCYGVLQMSFSSEPVTEFTYEDVLNYRVNYRTLRGRSSAIYDITAQCNETKSIRLTDTTLSGGKQMELVLMDVHASYASYAFHESLWFYVGLQADYFDELTSSNFWESEQPPLISENIILETSEIVSIGLRRKLNSDEVRRSPAVLFRVIQPPFHGILILRTPSFVVRRTEAFTLADVLAQRVAYEVNKSFEFSPQLHEFKDCILLSLVKSQIMPTDITMSNADNSNVRVCIIRKRSEFKFQTFDLTVGDRKNLSLNEANLQPFLTDISIRHDQPMGRQQQDQIYQKTPLQKHFPLLMPAVSVTSTPNGSTEKLVYFLNNQPKHGILFSRRLNRSVFVFSNQDLSENDVFYIYQKSTPSELVDSVQLRAFSTFDEKSFGTLINLKIYLQQPRKGLHLFRNRPMIVTVNSFVRLSSDNLAAGYGPTNIVPEIEYELTTTYGGYLAYVSNLYKSIKTFTQEDLGQGRVVFMHNGADTKSLCRFDFFITYGNERSTSGFHFDFHLYQAHIELVQMRTLEAFPLGFERIQSWHLKHRIRLESAQQSGDRRSAYLSASARRHSMTIMYGVLSQPKHGRLVKWSLPLTLSKNALTEHYENVEYFTQDDINDGRIFYVFNDPWNKETLQDGSENSFKLHKDDYLKEIYRTTIALTPAKRGIHQTADSFLLNISAYQRSLEEAMILPLPWSRVQHIAQFNISVDFSHVNRQNQDRLFKIRPVVVDEDGTEELTWNNIDPRPLLNLYEHNTVSSMVTLRLRLIKQPRHGSLSLSDGSPFSEVAVTKNCLTDNSFRAFYVHDGSETVNDSIYLKVDNNHETHSGDWIETGIKIPVRIRPVNDQRPRVIRPNSQSKFTYASLSSSSISLSHDNFMVECLVGLPMIISKEQLYAVDDDSPPRDIQFDLTSYPEFGHLCLLTEANIGDYVFASQNACQPCGNQCSFSQADVDENRLVYMTNFHAVSSPILDTFTFHLRDFQQDGVKREQIGTEGTIAIRIWPVELVSQTSIIHLLQGQDWAPVNQNHIQITLRTTLNHTFARNALQSEWLWLTVVQPPSFGRLCLDTVPVNSFSFADLLKGRVNYKQTSKSSAIDSTVIRAEVDPFSGPLWKARRMFTEYAPPHRSEMKSLHTEFSLYIEVKPLLTLSKLEIQPGARAALIKDVFNTSMLWNLIRQTDNGNDFSYNFTPVVTFPRATHLRLGRFLVNDDVVVASGYPDSDLTSHVNVSLESIDSGALKFESYQFLESHLRLQSELEENIDFVVWAGPAIQPARGSIKVRILPNGHNLFTTDLLKSVRHVPHSSGSGMFGAVTEVNASKSLYITTVFLVVGLCLGILLAVTGLLLYLYRRRVKSIKLWQLRRLSGKELTEGADINTSNPQSSLTARLITTTQSDETNFRPTYQLPVDTKGGIKQIEITNATHQCTSHLRQSPQPNTLSECSCDFGGAVIYVTPTQHNTFHTFPCTGQFATPSQLNTDFVVLSDLSSTGLQMIASSPLSPNSASVTDQVCDTSYSCTGQTCPPRITRLSNSTSRDTNSNESVLSQPYLNDKTVEPLKREFREDEAMSLKAVIPAVDMSSPTTSIASNVTEGAQTCLIQITPYPANAFTFTPVDSVPMWVAHQP